MYKTICMQKSGKIDKTMTWKYLLFLRNKWFSTSVTAMALNSLQFSLSFLQLQLTQSIFFK